MKLISVCYYLGLKSWIFNIIYKLTIFAILKKIMSLLEIKGLM